MEIDAIRLRTCRVAVRGAPTEPKKWAPQTRGTADHSIPYLIAVAFLDGAVSPASFTPKRLQDPAVHHLIARMTVEEDPGFTDRFPEDYPCSLEVTTKAGRRLAAETSHPPGHGRNPLSKDSSIGSASLTDPARNPRPFPWTTK